MNWSINYFNERVQREIAEWPVGIYADPNYPCMVNEMDSNNSRSVTQFEKANPKTMKMCERKAGWK